MRTVYWVYIAEDRKGGMTIGFSVAMSRTLIEVSMREETIKYLRPFSVPFDGLAHKHLLGDLSKDTLRDLVRRNWKRSKSYLSGRQLPFQISRESNGKDCL